MLLFDADYRLVHAVELTADQVRALSKHRPHVNGHVLIATDKLLADGVDVVDRFSVSPGA